MQPVTVAEARRRLARQAETRDGDFLELLERGVFANPRSPYLALFRHGGIGLEDVRGLVRTDGLSSALSQLYDAGVRVSLEEVKGRRPIVRPGLELAVGPESFDNPVAHRHLEARSSGSRGSGRKLYMDFGHLRYEADQHALLMEAAGMRDRPNGLWFPTPPAFAGLAGSLICAKNGVPTLRWFSQTGRGLRVRSPRMTLFFAAMLVTTRIWGPKVAVPRPATFDDAVRVARWLAEQAASGTPASLGTYPSSAVRACAAAAEHGLDVSGTLFLLSGEAFTPAKAQALAAAGGRSLSYYAMTELGTIGQPCADASVVDDVHLLTNRLGVVQRARKVPGSSTEIGALSYTTLLPSAPKLMLNVDSGDYGVLEERPCSCYLGQAGLTHHVHSIGSYEKLTSEGMTFLGSEVVTLVEEILPRIFGGTMADYQFVDEEEAGLAKLSVLVDPSVGPIDEQEVVRVVLRALGRREPGRLMAEVWRAAGTLTVVRRPPLATVGGKTLPLHVAPSA